MDEIKCFFVKLLVTIFLRTFQIRITKCGKDEKMIRNFFKNGYMVLFLLLLFIFHLLTVDLLSVNKIDKFIRFFQENSNKKLIFAP